MRRIVLFLAAPLLVFLMCVGCMKNPSELAEPSGYDGFVQLGWQAIEQGRYLEALNFFQQAIDVNVNGAEGFLGAGVSSVFLEDYWELGDNFFQVAIHNDHGGSVVVKHLEEVQFQDTLWTVFQCVDPDLPRDSLNLWLSFTADSGEVWVNGKIFDYLSVNGFSTDLLFRFSPEYDNAVACLDIYRAQSGAFNSCDSTASGFIYVTIPVRASYMGGMIWHYSWIVVGQNIIYDYAVFDSNGSTGQITQDALAGRLMLQEIRGTEGDVLQAVACAYGLLQVAPNYQFGADDPVREGVFDIDAVDVAASGASCAFFNQKYIYSWFMCKQVGYGLDLDPQSDNFLLEILELIMQMKS